MEIMIEGLKGVALFLKRQWDGYVSVEEGTHLYIRIIVVMEVQQVKCFYKLIQKHFSMWLDC